METWKTIEPDQWKPANDGESITGILVAKEQKTGVLSAKYSIDDAENIKIVWGSTILDSRMQYVNIGQKVRITFKGKTKNKKNQDLNLYKVEVTV